MDRVAFNILGKDIYWYGIIITCGLVLGMVLAVVEARRRGYTAEVILDFLILAVPMAVIGARAYYVIFNYELYRGDILKMIAIWDGGIAIYGAVIGGVVAALLVNWVKKFPALVLLDMCAPSLILGQAIGRWGNFINQEAYGRAILNTRWQFFPVAVKIDIPKIAGQLPGYYMATFFYEFAWNMVVFIILMLIKKRLRQFRGAVFAAYLILYGVGRFFIEGLRTDSLMLTDTIRVSQALALGLVIIGGFYLALVMTKKPICKAYEGQYLFNQEAADAERVDREALKEQKKREKEEKRQQKEADQSNEKDE